MQMFSRRLFVFVMLSLVPLFSNGEVQKKYIISIDPERYQSFVLGNQRDGSFLTLRSANAKFLDQLQMIIANLTESQIAELKKQEAVIHIEEDQIIPQPHFRQFRKTQKLQTTRSKNGELTWGIKAIAADKAWGVTKGNGVRVLVLDTGVDATHPDLIQRFEKGQSFMGGDINDDVGHGTHTSGTVIADGAGSGLMGVAPGARFLMAKVCSGAGCSTSGIIQGVDWGISEKVDVMNLSLGGPFLSFSAQQAYVRAEKAGVVVVAASGNSGTSTVSYPAAVSTVLAVGALNPDLTKAPFSQWGPELDVMAPGVDVLSSLPQGTGREGLVTVDLGQGLEELINTVFQNSSTDMQKVSGLVEHCGLGKPEDFMGKDLSGKIALISRGEITFAEKVANALKVNAAGVLVYNNEPGIIAGGLQNPVKIPVLMIEQAAGATMAQTATLSAEIGVVPSDYGSLQGTSMASPHVAGVAALVKSINPAFTALQVRQIINSSTHPLLPNPNNEFGNGVVDAEMAVNAAVAMSIPMAAGF